MGIITSIFLFCFLILSLYLNQRDRIAPKLSLCNEYLFYWFVIVFAGCFHFYGLYEISSIVYILVIIGSLSFFLGYRIFNISQKNLLNQNENDSSKIQYVKYTKTFYIVLCLALLIIIKQISLILPIIIARGMAAARAELAFDDTLFLSPQLEILLAYFAKPFAKASVILVIVNSVRTRFSIDSIILILTITLIYFFSGGGRTIIMDVFFVLCYMVYINKDLITKKAKKAIKKFIIFVALLPIAATLERGSDVMGSIYTYYCGSLQFFSQAFNLRNDLFEEYLYGLSSFQGFIKPITGILQVFGINKPQVVKEASDFIIDAQTTVYDIAPSYEMNYFYTTYGYSYKDAGIFGVIIVHIIFGMMCKYVDRKQSISKESIRWTAIKATFFYCILYTMSYFPFAMYLHAMTLVYIYIITTKLFTQKRTVNINNNNRK